MSMTLKTTKNLCFGLSVVFKITTRRSTIDVRKKSDLSRKNRTTGPPGHVRKISDQPQPVYQFTNNPARNVHARTNQFHVGEMHSNTEFVTFKIYLPLCHIVDFVFLS